MKRRCVQPTGCGETLTATALWQVKRFSFGNSTNVIRPNFMKCNHWIEAPADKQIQWRVTYIENPECRFGCPLNAIEPKVGDDPRATNHRFVLQLLLWAK
ncbi:unnamed protein product [Strongylus vulgaris]|uniref:Uncharacterized protein n=1 Tax=Strongylus vulgaris TaxID=40348 RepID=A0A3P7J4C4_STRVU|nr:unnamed protein product [Strongylus vulgaris]